MKHCYFLINRKTPGLAALVISLSLFLFSLPAQAIIFGDGDFVPSQWQSQTFLTQTSTAMVATMASGGNPADFRAVDLYSSGGFLQPMGRSMIVDLNTTAVVSPAAVGGITQVNYAEDHYCQCIGGGVLWGPAVEQGGSYYIVPGNAMPNAVSGWYNESLTGLTGADFELVDVNSNTWSNPAVHTDFSAAGAPVTFGYVRAKAFIANTESGLDNWGVAVNESAVATESQTWGTLKGLYR